MNIKSTWIICLSTICVSMFLSSCGSKMEKAEEHFRNIEYMEAATVYREAYKNSKTTKEDKQKAAFQIAECYRLNHDSKNALKWYGTAERKGIQDPMLQFRMAQMMKEQGNYSEAMEKFKQYKKAVPNDPNVDLQIKGCEIALEDQNRKSRYKISSFKPANESKVDDFSPMWGDRRKKSLMFTTDRADGESKKTYSWTGRKHTDIWIIEQEGGRRRPGEKPDWKEPEIVAGLNTDFNDGVVTFDRRFSTMYFTQCNGESGQEKTCKIYEARRRGREWSVYPTPLPFCSDSFNCGHPALSPDGNQMYFVSDMPGGYGDGVEKDNVEKTKDIYVSNYVRRGRTWGDPVNLGPTINTEGNELFPYVHDDGELYFSSDGHPGLGGLDIYKTKGVGTEWATPANMRAPINSNGDDFGIVMDETKESGYFTSNRERGDDDIWEFYMEPIECTLQGQVTDCDSGTVIPGALVIISNNHDSTKIRLYTDEAGKYETPLKINTNYEIIVTKRDEYYYDAKPKFITTEGVENSAECQHVKNFCLKNQCNDIFVLPIYYDLDKAFLRAESQKVLDELVKTLKTYPKMKVELGSHTDCRAPYEYNRKLSQRRADSAVKYIVENGINPLRLDAKGYGESELVNECECEGAEVVPCTDDQHQANRRTTVKVVNCNFVIDTEVFNVINQNENALEGQGLAQSPYLKQVQIDFIKTSKGNIDSLLQAREDAIIAEREAAEKRQLLEKYDIIPLQKRRDDYEITAYVERSRVRLKVDLTNYKTKIPQEVVEQLMRSKQLTVDNFKKGNDKFKLANGEKISSRSFTLPELKLGDYTFYNIKCRMGDPRTDAVLGINIFRDDYEGEEIKDGQLWLQKIIEE